jgi:hypothetical protein
MLLYISASSARSDLARSAPYPSTSCLTSEIAPADLEPPPADNMSDVSVPSMSALTVHGGPGAGEGVHLGPVKGSSSSSGVDAVDSYLLPEDLLHLTRRSLFLVVDSDNSSSFMRLQVGLRGVCGSCAAMSFVYHQDIGMMCDSQQLPHGRLVNC